MTGKDFFTKYQQKYNKLIISGHKIAALKVIDNALHAASKRQVEDIILAKLFSARGKLYYDLTNHSMALDSYFKALHLVKDEIDKMTMNFFIANCYMGLKDTDNAVRLFTHLLEQNNSIKNREKFSIATNDMGGVIAGLVMCYAFQGRLDLANETIGQYFRPDQLKKLNPIALMDYYHAMGEVRICEKNYAKAEEDLAKSILIAEKHNFRDTILAGRVHLAQIEIIRNNYSKALEILNPMINKADEKYICLFVEICLLAGKICAYTGGMKRSERLLNRCKKYIKHSEPMWLFKLIKEQDELFRSPLSGPVTARNIARISSEENIPFEPVQIIGQNEELVKVLAAAAQIAKTDLPVLINGETGTGKELFARLMHYTSNRANNPFVPVNCGGLSETLLETELFGYKKGAFTGAFSDRKGIFEFARGGTIFLDECAEMPQSMQKDLLRILEEKKLRRVGDNNMIDIDVRIIFATNKNLKELIAQGRFREDLFFRINVFALNIPPLRLRKDDILALVTHFTKKLCKSGANVRIKPSVLRLFDSYDWPGNVRELENEIKRIVSMYNDVSVIDETMIGTHILQAENKAPVGQPPGAESLIPFREFERRFIVDALRRCNNNVSRTANAVSLSRVGLIKKMKRLGISVSREIKS